MSFDVADIVHSIQEDEAVKEPLITILRKPTIERNDALKRLSMKAKADGAPQELVDALMQLQQTRLAKLVLQELTGGSRKPSGPLGWLKSLFSRG